MLEGVAPAQLTRANKAKVEAQNFNIKQPQLSGDVYAKENYREKARPLNGVLETINEDENHKSTHGGSFLNGGRVQSAINLNQIDYRKTNFNLGNEYQNEFSRIKSASKFRTIEAQDDKEDELIETRSLL